MTYILKWLLSFILILIIFWIIAFVCGAIGALHSGQVVWKDGWFKASVETNSVVSAGIQKQGEEVEKAAEAKNNDGNSKTAIFFLCAAAIAFFIAKKTGEAKPFWCGLFFLAISCFYSFELVLGTFCFYYIVIPVAIGWFLISLFQTNN